MPSENLQPVPLTQPGLSDYHCHCDYSVDADGTIDEYCRVALRLGLAEICFTTHYDTNPDAVGFDGYIRIKGQRLAVSPVTLEPYVEDVRCAHDRYYPCGLSVKLGIEVGWWPGCVDSLVTLRDRFAFDHVLCGIHEVDNLCLASHRFHEYFRDYSLDELVEKYYMQTLAATRTGLFDALAHLAYYVRFGLAKFGEEVYSAHRPYLDELLRSLQETETALEVNTSAIRHGFHHYYPPMMIINAAKKAGVGVRFLGSDAHRPDQIAVDFDAASALVPCPIVSRDG